MESSSTVLLIFRDRLLAETRAAVLRSADYKVLTATDDPEISLLLPHCDIVLLCSSLSLAEQQQRIVELQPFRPVIVLHHTQIPTGAAAAVNGLDGPTILLKKLRAVVDALGANRRSQNQSEGEREH